VDRGTQGGSEALSDWALSPTGVGNREAYHATKAHWLEYDSVALAVLVIGIGMVELLALLM
jgi:hypothetical protein